ncbi:MAG TPA: IS982 family transposase [Candidatus Methylomirabilis sp.]|nr:IS982 family transposase [Candidatus Methylomirabilis sp.]
MLVLKKHHITDLYVWTDELLPKHEKSGSGRPKLLSPSEVITILIWNGLTGRSKTLKDIYRSLLLYHQDDFPSLPKYKRFVENCHEVLPDLLFILNQILAGDSAVKIMDSTMLEVCKLVRADIHKTCKNIAQFGKNHQGWHYGFKLHASVNLSGQLGKIFITPANFHDAQAMPNILNEKTILAVGDGGYTASVMKKYIFENYGTIVVSPPHPKQNKKLLTLWQYKLLKVRPKIESVFDYLKEHMNLVSSFPRSVMGYLLHYIRIVLAYQVMAII